MVPTFSAMLSSASISNRGPAIAKAATVRHAFLSTACEVECDPGLAGSEQFPQDERNEMDGWMGAQTVPIR